MEHGADDLRLLSQLLDACSERPVADRQAWLDGLRGDAARLRPALERMLARQDSRVLEGFLEHPPQVVLPEALAPAHDFHADDCIGPYRLLRPIGRGGMGEVWLATRADGQLKRGVALKLPVLSVRRSVLVQRFERERDILGALIHPHIARLYDAGVADDGQPYMALEYVEGTPITEAADEAGLDVRARVQLLRQVMDAVQYAHANLVIHRDLKPGNVLVTAGGQAKLLDFGIAKLVEEEVGAGSDSELTRQGGRALTLRYAAPELLGGGTVSIAVDVWALGVLLYELLAARRPFEGPVHEPGTWIGIEQQILMHDPARPSLGRSGAIARLSRSLAADLDTIALKALKKNPAERYATVGAFADDLDRWLRGEPVRAQRDTGWYRARRFVGRNRLAVAGATLAGVLLVASASAAVSFGLQAREESARALAAREFMVNLFRRADPDLSQGREVSAKQLLKQGHKTVLETLEGQPLLQSELLRAIGRALESTFDLPATDEAYDQAALRYERVGNRREAAALLLDRAALRLGSVWDIAAASDLLERAEAMHPRPASDEEFLARRAIYRSFAAHLAGDESARQTWSVRARAHVDRGLPDTGPRAVLAVRVLALVEVSMSEPRRATERLSLLLERLRLDAATRPVDTLSVLVELGVAERAEGRYRAALGRYEAARALCQTVLNPTGSQCAYNQFHLANLLLLLGMDAAAMEAVPFLTPARGAVETSWDTRQLVQAYEVLAHNGRLHEQPDVVGRVVAAGQASSDDGEHWHGRLASLVAQGRHHLRQGEPALMQALSAQAQTLVSERGLAEEPFVLPASALHAISLHTQGLHEAALQVLDGVQARLVQALGAGHPSVQLAVIMRARPLWALQRQAEALALLDQALPVLVEAMGPDAPTLRKIRALRDELAAARPGSMPNLKAIELHM